MSSPETNAPLLGEDELRQALAPFAPDEEAFLGEVRRRVTEAGGDPEGEISSEESAGNTFRSALWKSPFLRRAASILPMKLLTGEAVPAAKVAGTKLGWKGLGALVSFPAVSLLMLVMTFLAAVGALRRNVDGEELAPGEARAEINLWWWGHWWQALLVLFAFGVLCATQPLVTGVGLFVVSMATLVLILRHLDRYGVVSAAQVGRFTAGLLWGTGLCASMIPWPHGASWGGSTGQFATAAVLWTGAAVCAVAGGRGHPWSLWDRTRAVMVVVLALGLLWAILGRHTPSLDECARAAEGFAEELDHRRADRWGRLVRSLRAVQECRGGELDLREQAARVEEAGAGYRSFAKVARVAQRAGIFPRGALEVVWSEEESLALRDPRRPPPLRVPEVYRVAALVQGGLLDAERCELLARGLLDDWPAPEDMFCLEGMLERVELLEILGASSLLEERRAEVEDALLALWTGRRDGGATPAGFLPSAGDRTCRGTDHADIRSTDAALHLMLRYGIPPGIDAERLGRWLDRAATPDTVFDTTPFRDDLRRDLAAADYHLLEACLAARGHLRPSRPWSLRGLADPILLGALLLTALSLYATLSAERGGRAAR